MKYIHNVTSVNLVVFAATLCFCFVILNTHAVFLAMLSLTMESGPLRRLYRKIDAIWQWYWARCVPQLSWATYEPLTVTCLSQVLWLLSFLVLGCCLLLVLGCCLLLVLGCCLLLVLGCCLLLLLVTAVATGVVCYRSGLLSLQLL